jgi:D-glycero-alpha-D-manno-heptose 1-phosphate guanylyltransferase
MEGIVLAGGLGTRLRSRLSNLPKVMAPIAGRPFLEILLNRMVAAGCARIILSVGHLHRVISDAFGYSFQGAELIYAVEETPLGTGGAIRLALGLAKENSILVLNGDTFLELDLRAFLNAHLAAGRPLSLAITEVTDVGRYGGVLTDGDSLTGFIEKGRVGAGWINGGVYAMPREFPWPKHLPPRFSFENDLLVPMVGSLRPLAFRCKGHFLDIGIPEDLDRAETKLTAFLPHAPDVEH